MMNTKISFVSTIAILLTSLLTLTAAAQTVPNLVNYQGRLTDQTGAPLASGTYGIQFLLWDTPVGSNVLVWAQQQTVPVQSNGAFNVLLGSPTGSAIAGVTPAVTNLSLAFAGTNRFLGL